jgi:hypothetical protein
MPSLSHSALVFGGPLGLDTFVMAVVMQVTLCSLGTLLQRRQRDPNRC